MTDFCTEEQEARLQESIRQWIQQTTKPIDEWQFYVDRRDGCVTLRFDNWDMYGYQTKWYQFEICEHPEKGKFILQGEKAIVGSGPQYDFGYGMIGPPATKTQLRIQEIPAFDVKDIRDRIKKIMCAFEPKSFRIRGKKK